MISSVVILNGALPRRRANLLFGGRPPRRTTVTLPSAPTSKSTVLPGFTPKCSLTRFGMVTCPLLVTRTLLAPPVLPGFKK